MAGEPGPAHQAPPPLACQPAEGLTIEPMRSPCSDALTSGTFR